MIDDKLKFGSHEEYACHDDNGIVKDNVKHGNICIEALSDEGKLDVAFLEDCWTELKSVINEVAVSQVVL